MKNKTANIYFFSGTGNTLIVTDKIAETFAMHNIKVNKYHIEKTDPRNIDMTSLIGIVFPVAFQSTFPLVWDFVRNLPAGNGTEIFMADTLHFFSGAVVGPMKKLLRKKGYRTIAAKEIIMPNNLYPFKEKKQEIGMKIAKGLNAAEKFALSMINENSSWKRLPVISDIFYFLVSRKFVWSIIAAFGRWFIIKKDRCTKCGLCADLCPVKNIRMAGFPVYGSKCQQCLRCVMFCPVEAIIMPIWKYARYKAVDEKMIKA